MDHLVRRALAPHRRPFKRPKIVIHMFEACPGRFGAFGICDFAPPLMWASSTTTNERRRRGELSVYGPCSSHLACRCRDRHPIARPGTITPARADAKTSHAGEVHTERTGESKPA
ncbi:hypothetical protein Purlil1_13729 [Purpureocillium lilacinum]|uniref:Uncharacterized protein n=1 Tax=Purpureocillium lilacinum TaxID=33203 RepID=A0ABR0BD95_PURLI|nr:hypothetical protein Purlil1_13729 [Purpureocillium lilacinum]